MAAHFVDSEDCQGQPERYWREFLADSEGNYVGGYGSTAEQAERDAAEKLVAREEWLAQSAEKQLLDLVSKDGYLLSNDMSRAIKLLSELVLRRNGHVQNSTNLVFGPARA